MPHTSSSTASSPAAALPDPSAAEPWQRPVDCLPLPAIQQGEQKLVGFALQEATRIAINRMSSRRAPSTQGHDHQHGSPTGQRTHTPIFELDKLMGNG